MKENICGVLQSKGIMQCLGNLRLNTIEEDNDDFIKN